MKYKNIMVTKKFEDQVVEVALGPEPANILTSEVMQEISDLLRKINSDSDKKLVIFSGQGKHFSFGASVEEHKPELVNNMLPSFHNLIEDLIDFKVPTLAKVTGQCLGGGFELALACQFIFADETAKFAVPEIQLGVFPPVACILLPLKSNDQFSNQMILSGKTINAEQANKFGFLTQLTSKEGLEAGLSEFVENDILPKSASSLSIACQASRVVLSDLYKNKISDLEKLYLNELMQTSDAKEGIQSFIEKRPPNWINA